MCRRHGVLRHLQRAYPLLSGGARRWPRGRAVTALGGAGLGRAIVESLVQAHGGSVHLDSAQGRGATFPSDCHCLRHDSCDLRNNAGACVSFVSSDMPNGAIPLLKKAVNITYPSRVI
jgi:hypothetical protein